MLSAAQQGVLIVSTLNKLPTLSDIVDPDLRQVVEGCCPNCCAPCGVVRQLHLSGDLDEVVTWAPNHMWRDVLWWRSGHVDRVWLYAIWDCTSRPRCDDGRFVDAFSVEAVCGRLSRQAGITVPQALGRLKDRLVYEQRKLARR